MMHKKKSLALLYDHHLPRPAFSSQCTVHTGSSTLPIQEKKFPGSIIQAQIIFPLIYIIGNAISKRQGFKNKSEFNIKKTVL